MVVASSSSSSSLSLLSPLRPLSPFYKSNPLFLSINPTNHSSPTTHHRRTVGPRATTIRRISAAPDGGFLVSEAKPPEIPSEIVSVNNDGVSTTISVLLFIAFAGLSILTIGVIYIAVTDYLQKREKDRFEKEEAAKAKKGGGKKRKVRSRSRAGPRGFGQKIDDDNDQDDNDL